MDSTLPPSSRPPSPPPVRLTALDPYAAISGSKATEPWRPPGFAKRERSPSSPTSASPAYHKRVKTEDVSSSPFGVREFPPTSSPFGTPPRYTPAVPRSPFKESLYEKQERIWAEQISLVMDDIRENSIDLRLLSLQPHEEPSTTYTLSIVIVESPSFLQK